MQKKINTWIWVFLVLFLGWGTMGEAEARKDRTLCGVDVSYQYGCWKELRSLVRACKTTPVICGRSYKNGTMPKNKVAQGHCKSMYRSNRKQWSQGLCGVRLFSKPNTFCGVRGVMVAAACVRMRNKGMKPTASVGLRSKAQKRSIPSARKRALKKVANRKATKAAPHVAVLSSKKKPVIGQVQANSATVTSPSGEGGSSFWLYALQFLILGLVMLLLFRSRARSSTGRAWEQRSTKWNDMDSQWGMTLDQDNDTDLSRVEHSLDQIELRLQAWEEKWEESLQGDDPVASLKLWAASVHSYYCKIAEVLAEGRGQQPLSDVQTRLIEARNKLRWMFQAHREPLGQASAIEQLQLSLLAHSDSLLEQTGFVEEHLQIPNILSQGEFTVDDFLSRKAEDQAQRFIQDEPLQNFSAIRNEFLQRLEQLYRSNLSGLLQTDKALQTVEISEQNQIFLNEYILGFLLSELPSKLEGYSHHSNRERSGALADMMLQFIDDELESTGLELFPAYEKSEFMSAHARFMYLARAGVRMIGEPEVVLREAEQALLDARPQMESTEHEVQTNDVLDDIVQATAEYSSQSPEMMSMDQMIGVSVVQAEPVLLPEPVAPPPMPVHSPMNLPQVQGASDHTAAYSQDLLGDIEEITVAHRPNPFVRQTDSYVEEHIGNPDSDPPTEEATTDTNAHAGAAEPLPVGPLPNIDPTQNYAGAGQKRGKITREYGPFQHDSELPYSLNPSKD